MSSLRNAVKRITHKERSQPRNRAHLGILEKKGDYKQRAQHFHRKQDSLKAMKRKAVMRNPDEFYFGMKNSQVQNGHHRKTQQALQKEREHEIGPEAVRLMKDQDLRYIRMQVQKESKKRQRLEESLHYLGTAEKKRKHTIFVETQEEAEAFDVATHFDTLPELAGRAFHRPRKEMLLKQASAQQEKTEEDLAQERKNIKRLARKLARARTSAYNELTTREKRIETMERAEAHLVTEKLLAGKGRKRKIKDAEDGKPAIYKWRRKRAK